MNDDDIDMKRLFFYIYKFLETKGVKNPFGLSISYLTSLFFVPWVLTAGFIKEWKDLSIMQVEVLLLFGIVCGFAGLYYVFKKNETYLIKYKYKRRKPLTGTKKALMLASPVCSLCVGGFFCVLIHNNGFLVFLIYCFRISIIYYYGA